MKTLINAWRRWHRADRTYRSSALVRFLTLAIALLLLQNSSAWAQCERLFWQDEFNGPEIDRSKWELENRGDGQGTRQLDYATDRPENARIVNGELQLNILKEEYKGLHYTSARMRTYKKLDFQYGRVVARVKGVYSQGNGFAFWMLGSDYERVTWPKCGEVDIFENTGRTPDRNIGTAHFAGPKGEDAISQGDTILPGGQRWADAFHDVGIEWSPTYIKWTIDGRVYHTMDLTNPINGYRPFNRPFFLILSVGMGGTYSLPPDATTITPMTATVDWVRIYKGTYSTFVSGDEQVYQGEQNKQYTVSAIDNGTYAWTVPAGATIVAGQGTNTVTVDWGQTGGAVSVRTSSPCTSNLTYSLNVTAEAPFVVDKVFENFETPPAFTYTTLSGSLTKGAPNPLVNALNPSPKVGKYIRNDEAPYDVIGMQNVNASPAGDFLIGKRRILLDVYTDAAPGARVSLNFENSRTANSGNYPTGRYANFEAVTTKRNQWETLEFALTGSPDANTGASNVDQWILLFAPVTYTGNVFYYDNLRTGQPGGTPRVLDTRVLQDFDGNDQLTKDFSDGAYTVQANPSPAALNTSATVAKYVRNASVPYDALVYKTLVINDGRPFRLGTSTVSMELYSSAPVGTRLSLNFELSSRTGAFPTGRYANFEAVTTRRNQWETVTFSLSSIPDRDASDAAVDKLVFLFNPVTNTGDTYYFDNIRINSTAPKETLVPATVWEDYDANRNLTLRSTTGAYTPQAANPAPGGVNASTNVARYVRAATEQYDLLVFNKGTAAVNATALKQRTQRIALDVYTSAPAGTPISAGLDAGSLVTATNYPTGRHSNYQGVTTVQNAWHTVYFTFSTQPDASAPDNLVDRVALLFKPGTLTNDTYYFDNFRVLDVRQQPTLTTIAVAPALAQNVAVGQRVQFTAQGKDQAGANFTTPITWAVSGGGSIDADGLFTAAANGAFKVTATSNGVTSTANVLVGQGIRLTTVKVDPIATFVYQGDTLPLTARGYDQTGAAFAITPAWTTTGATGVTVSANGVLTASATASGTASVVASSGGLSAMATIQVRATPAADSLAVSPAAAKVYQSDALQFRAKAFDQYRNPLTAAYAWTASGGGSIDANGLYTSTTVGTFVVKAQAGTAAAATYVSVVPKPSNLALHQPARASSVQRTQRAFYATDGVTVRATPDTRWAAADTTSNQWLRVDLGQNYDLSRVVLYWEIAYGKAYEIQVADDTLQARRLAYRETAGNGKDDNLTLPAGTHGRYVWMQGIRRGASYPYSLYEIEVYGLLHQAPALTSIIVTPNFSTVAPNKSVAFAAAGFDQFGNASATVPTWTASGGTISSTGAFSATAAGTYTVTAASGGVSGTASITVAAPVVAGQLIPGRVEAESYSAMRGVATEPTADTGGGRNVSYLSPGDWLDYAVNVQTAGTYTVQLRVAGFAAGAGLQLLSGSTVLATVAVPTTGGGQRWATTPAVPVTLPAGPQTLRLAVTGGGFNLNWLDFAAPAAARTALATAPAARKNAQPLNVFPNPATQAITLTGLGTLPTIITVYDARGALMQRVYHDQLTDSAVLNVSALKSGLYVIRVSSAGSEQTQRFVKE